MRLIDADKTKVYTYELDKQVFVDAITRFISLQPTVEAIPIEWIEGYIKKFMAPLYEKGEFDSDCPEAKFAHNLENMIASWSYEKEEL